MDSRTHDATKWVWDAETRPAQACLALLYKLLPRRCARVESRELGNRDLCDRLRDALRNFATRPGEKARKGAHQAGPDLRPSFLRRKPQHRDSVDTRFRPGEEAVSPKSPAQQMVRRMSSLGSAARTSAGSFSGFRHAMSRRSSEGSPLAGGEE